MRGPFLLVVFLSFVLVHSSPHAHHSMEAMTAQKDMEKEWGKPAHVHAMEQAAPSSPLDSCVEDPTAAACAQYTYPDSEVLRNIESLCSAMSNMIGCSIHRECLAGQAYGQYCNPFSILQSMCKGDGMMGSMGGCYPYNKKGMAEPHLCQAGSQLRQCKENYPIPNVMATMKVTDSVISACSEHSMTGCDSCTDHGHCPDPLLSMSKMCQDMFMSECSYWIDMCFDIGPGMEIFCGTAGVHGNTDAFCNGFGSVMYNGFTVDVGDAMSPCVVYLFQGWLLDSQTKYMMGFVGTIFLGILSEGIVCYRRTLQTAKEIHLLGLVTIPRGSVWKDVLMSLFYALNVSLGYMLMLVAMTYHLYLFIAILLGLAIGHGVFNLRHPVSESVDPCCQHDVNIGENAKPSSSVA